MKLETALTFLKLGDATSRNLAFSYEDDVWVSYGEETITETNLLEIRRRHPKLVRIFTISKRMEAKNGADWEWHIVGRRHTLKMRVQAKRIQRNGILKVKHKVKSSGQQQRSLLIAGAKAAKMKAVYCIYCTESQRSFWKETKGTSAYRSFQAGCLLADASDVHSTTTCLAKIEKKCKPWHYLFVPTVLVWEASEYYTDNVANLVQVVSVNRLQHFQRKVGEAPEPAGDSGWRAPTVDDLNHGETRDFDWTGVGDTTEEDLARINPDAEAGSSSVMSDEERLQDLGIRFMLVMDVRGETEFDERHRLQRP